MTGETAEDFPHPMRDTVPINKTNLGPSSTESSWKAPRQQEHDMPTPDDNRQFHLRRERQERESAAASPNPAIQSIHVELAERHARCAGRQSPRRASPENDAAPSMPTP